MVRKMPGPRASNIKPSLDPAVLWMLSLFAEAYAEVELRNRVTPLPEGQKLAALEKAAVKIVKAAGRKFPPRKRGRPASLMAIFRRLEVRKRVERDESVKAAVEKAYS